MTNTEKLNRIIELLTEIEKEPESWDKGTKAKMLANIQEALKLALLMRI
jgi:hypothetical protein